MKKNSILLAFIILFFIFSSLAGFLAYKSKIEKEKMALQEYSSEYFVNKLNCIFEQNSGANVTIEFGQLENSKKKTPKYSLKNSIEKAESSITFYNVGEVNTSFLYNEIIGNPLIEDLGYEKKGFDFTITIKRKGYLAEPQIIQQGNSFAINFPNSGEGFPKFLNQSPQPDSIVFPSNQKIKTSFYLSSPIKQEFVFINGKEAKAEIIPIDSTTTGQVGAFNYEISTTEKLSKNETYKIKVIIIDENQKASAIGWEFMAKLPQQRGILGPDRFKNLGWWGQINTNQTRVRKEPSTKSEILGELSTINTVKVLDEVGGEEIEGNSEWYKIDGGKYAGGYVFSQAITPIIQPEPPENAKIPEEVKPGSFWINVDVKKEIFTLFEYDKPIFTTFVSTGRKGSETITGTYHIYYKLLKKRMVDNPPNFEHGYDIPNVPSVMFYKGSYAIHGTYWHDRFSTQQSAGCTNMTQGDAAFVFSKVSPVLPSDRKEIKTEEYNQGTVVFNHE